MKKSVRRDDNESLVFLKKKLVNIEILNSIILLFSLPLFICTLYILIKIWLGRYNSFKLGVIIIISISIVYVFEAFIEKVCSKKTQKLQKEYDEMFLIVKRKELFDNNSKISLKDDSKIKDKTLKMLFERTTYQLNALDNGTYKILVTAKIDETFEFPLKDLYEVLENVKIDK